MGMLVVARRVIEAARKAIYSPLLETTIDGAEDVIVNVTGGLDMTLIEAEGSYEYQIKRLLDTE